MRVWQNPGEGGRAEWLCASSEASWKEKGGVWYKQLDPAPVFSVIVVRATQGWKAMDEPFYAFAKEVDVARMTLPEVQDLLRSEWYDLDEAKELPAVPELLDVMYPDGWAAKLILAAAEKGPGKVVGGRAGQTVRHVRTQAKKLVEDILDAPFEQLDLPISVHHRKWARIRAADPVEYTAGFITGMQRRDAGEEVNEAFLAGWRHGWEYVVGRVKLPAWFIGAPSETDGGRDGLLC